MDGGSIRSGMSPCPQFSFPPTPCLYSLISLLACGRTRAFCTYGSQMCLWIIPFLSSESLCIGSSFSPCLLTVALLPSPGSVSAFSRNLPRPSLPDRSRPVIGRVLPFWGQTLVQSQGSFRVKEEAEKSESEKVI